ncbi:unnamed protein product, partial [Didymodactylos carnosus]
HSPSTELKLANITKLRIYQSSATFDDYHLFSVLTNVSELEISKPLVASLIQYLLSHSNLEYLFQQIRKIIITSPLTSTDTNPPLLHVQIEIDYPKFFPNAEIYQCQ